MLIMDIHTRQMYRTGIQWMCIEQIALVIGPTVLKIANNKNGFNMPVTALCCLYRRSLL